MRNDWLWPRRPAVRPERRAGERHRRRILSIQPTYWQVYAMAMAIAVVVPIILTSVVYQRKYRQGTLQIV